MKKNVKILGAAAAALLAVAPVVASATVANASTVVVNQGSTTNVPSASPLNINVTLDATADQTPLADILSSVKVVPQLGTVQGFSAKNVKIYDMTLGQEVADGKLTAGHQYRVEVSHVNFAGLTTGQNYNLGAASFAPASATSGQTQNLISGQDLMTQGTFYSAPFNLTQAGNTEQPYFTNKSDSALLTNGATAYVNKGNGVSAVDVSKAAAVAASKGPSTVTAGNPSDYTADNILAAAKAAVTANPAGVQVTTQAPDIASQLASQNIAVKDGVYTVPTTGFHVTLTAKSLLSNKTVTVVVPFQGTEASYKYYPIIEFNSSSLPEGYTGFDQLKSVQGPVQKPSASQLVRNVDLNSQFGNKQATERFTAKTGSNDANINLAVLSNPVNTRVPGRYTVVLQATDWTNNKTTRLSYTVQVGKSDVTYQNVNYPAAYGVNIWSISGDTVSFTGNRQAGQTSVETYDTKTVNGVSYTRIGAEDANTWIQTQYLGNHSTEKPSNGETAMRGVAKVTFNGKGAVRLLNAEGHYVDQYVKKGSSFKVWAEKTVNGQHLYRIGSQSQWIPAKYVSVK